MANDSYTHPVVGVLCIDVSMRILDIYGYVAFYIDAGYVKFIELTGCQVIPIWAGRDEEYYRQIMKCINGILIPGGAVFIDSAQICQPEQTNICVESLEKIYRIACEMNISGTYFPLWGTCLGYELMLYHAFKGESNDEIREKCRRMSASMKVHFTDGYRDSKMFAKITDSQMKIFQSEPFAFHSHGYCITIDKLQQFKNVYQWRVTAVNRDADGLEFIACCEHKAYPFYGVQFHPEKVLFDFTRNNIERNGNIVECAQYFANFFASECRKCPNSFPSKEEVLRHSIHNFPVEYTAVKGLKHEQCYLFQRDADYPAPSEP